MFAPLSTSKIWCLYVHLIVTTALSKCSTIKSINQQVDRPLNERQVARKKTNKTKTVVPVPTRADISYTTGLFIDGDNSSTMNVTKLRSPPSHLYPRPCRQLEMTLTKSSRRKGRLSSHPHSPPSPSANRPSPKSLLLLLLVSGNIVRVSNRGRG